MAQRRARSQLAADTHLFIRHANPAVDRRRPAATWPLSDLGRARARALAGALAPYTPRNIVTSDEPKATETGMILADALGVTVVVAPNLHEHDRRGEPWFDDPAAWQARLAAFFAAPDALVYGRESAANTQRRVVAAVAAVLEHTPGPVAFVGHGTAWSLLLAHHGGEPAEALWRRMQALGMPALLAVDAATWRVLAASGV